MKDADIKIGDRVKPKAFEFLNNPEKYSGTVVENEQGVDSRFITIKLENSIFLRKISICGLTFCLNQRCLIDRIYVLKENVEKIV